jgi:hypothetical protein
MLDRSSARARNVPFASTSKDFLAALLQSSASCRRRSEQSVTGILLFSVRSGGACFDWCKIQVTYFDRLGAIKRRREGARGLPIYLDGHGMRPTDECTGASSAQACAGAREAASEVSMIGSSDRGDKEPDPIVEPKPGENAPPATSRALAKGIRQQEILAEIGVTALQGGGGC